VNSYCIFFSDERFPLELKILFQLIPPKGRVKTGGHHWKFSIVEALESVLVHVQVNKLLYCGYSFPNMNLKFLGT